MVRLGLVGGAQITASPSPVIHGAFLAAAHLEGTYDLLPAAPTTLAAVLDRVRGRYRGANVTMPHKLEAAAACDDLDGDAALLGAVNTLTVEGTRLRGGNTDAAGLHRALIAAPAWQRAMPGSALVLGAGGAARAAVLALGRAGVTQVTVAARRKEQADLLAASLSAHSVSVVSWMQAAACAAEVDALVNATPAAAAGLPVDPRATRPGCIVVDLRHDGGDDSFAAAGRRADRASLDGREMLLQQAALSFCTWTGITPSLADARAALGWASA